MGAVANERKQFLTNSTRKREYTADAARLLLCQLGRWQKMLGQPTHSYLLARLLFGLKPPLWMIV